MFVDKLSRSLTGRRLARLVRDRRGAAMMEFAIVAFPFFILLFGLLEILMIFVISTTLEYGVSEAARRIRTGEHQGTVGSNAATFKTLVCGGLYNLLDCDAKLQIDVRTTTSFTNASFSTPIDNDGNLITVGMAYTPGGAEDIVLVRAYYQWELITPILSAPMANMAGGKRLLIATAAFRNEPF